MNDRYPIIGMSPGNSYFKDEEIKYLLKQTIERFGHTAILVADIPAIQTYIALGYPENKARGKAVLKGNNLKNRTARLVTELRITDKVRIIDWEGEVKDNSEYRAVFGKVQALYNTNPTFTTEVDGTTRSVLEGSGKDVTDIEAATKTAVFYLLSELAFLQFAPQFFGHKKVTYVYHKNWSVYENYISGKFDSVPKQNLDFSLLENPHETYTPLQASTTGALRAAYSNYPPAFMTDESGTHSGIFYEVIMEITKRLGLEISFIEETGYGVITKGLQEGRFDIFCSTVWPTPEREQEASFSTSLYESLVHIWANADSPYTNNKPLEDNLLLRIATKEGDISDSIAIADFPLARQVRVPQLADPETLLEFLVEDKADITFVESSLAALFNKRWNTKVVQITTSPIRTYGNCFMLRKNGYLALQMNKVLEEMKSEGAIKAIIQKYKNQ